MATTPGPTSADDADADADAKPGGGDGDFGDFASYQHGAFYRDAEGVMLFLGTLDQPESVEEAAQMALAMPTIRSGERGASRLGVIFPFPTYSMYCTYDRCTWYIMNFANVGVYM